MILGALALMTTASISIAHADQAKEPVDVRFSLKTGDDVVASGGMALKDGVARQEFTAQGTSSVVAADGSTLTDPSIAPTPYGWSIVVKPKASGDRVAVDYDLDYSTIIDFVKVDAGDRTISSPRIEKVGLSEQVYAARSEDGIWRYQTALKSNDKDYILLVEVSEKAVGR